jgi:hypothetical protein
MFICSRPYTVVFLYENQFHKTVLLFQATAIFVYQFGKPYATNVIFRIVFYGKRQKEVKKTSQGSVHQKLLPNVL